MLTTAATQLTHEDQHRFAENGYLYPIPVLSLDEVESYRNKFLNHLERNRTRLAELPGSQKYLVLSEMHYCARWVYEIANNPRVLDAVESVLGPNLIVWATSWFAKMPGEKTFVSWHQDGMYWNLSNDKVITAWIALGPSTTANGCLRVVPGTHKQRALPHQETYHPDNALSRGQDIAITVDENDAVDIELQAGEMSLHHLWIVHGSQVNTSPDTPRIGLAVRYVSTEVRQDSPLKPLGMLVRGHDDFGHFELMPPPTQGDSLFDEEKHRKIIDRHRASVMPANT